MLTARMALWTPVLHIQSRHTTVHNNGYLKGLSYERLTLATVNNHPNPRVMYMKCTSENTRSSKQIWSHCHRYTQNQHSSFHVHSRKWQCYTDKKGESSTTSKQITDWCFMLQYMWCEYSYTVHGKLSLLSLHMINNMHRNDKAHDLLHS